MISSCTLLQPATRTRSESIEAFQGDDLLVMIIKAQPSVNRQEATMSNVIGMRKTLCDCHYFQWKFCALQHHVHRLREVVTDVALVNPQVSKSVIFGNEQNVKLGLLSIDPHPVRELAP